MNVTAKVNGTLWKTAFREGAIVLKGDLLFEIEDTIYKAKLQAAEAGLKQVEAEYDYAVKEYNRNKTLIDKKVISDAEFAIYEKNRASLEAKIAEMKATIKLCENDLSYTKIYAPITGIRASRRTNGWRTAIPTCTMATASCAKYSRAAIRRFRITSNRPSRRLMTGSV